jgi:hypothetical protein
MFFSTPSHANIRVKETFLRSIGRNNCYSNKDRFAFAHAMLPAPLFDDLYDEAAVLRFRIFLVRNGTDSPAVSNGGGMISPSARRTTNEIVSTSRTLNLSTGHQSHIATTIPT